MKFNIVKVNNKSIIFFTVILFNLSLFVNFSLMRQIVGFFFLLFIPGYSIILLLALNKLQILDKIILSVGLSTSYIMIFGYFLNKISLFLGYDTPFSTISLYVFFSISIITIISLKREDTKVLVSIPKVSLSISDKFFLIPAILFPIMSIAGTYLMNKYGNNSFLMLLLISISIYSSVLIWYNRVERHNTTIVFPFILYSISLSVILITGLRLFYVFGDDSCNEFYFFKMTLQNSYWSLLKGVTLDSCLSISVLPSIYQSITTIDSQFLFKVLYPVIVSFCPLVIYLTVKHYLDDVYSFVAGLFFISQYGFKATPLWCRINVAIFFFSLFIYILVNQNITVVTKRILTTFFLTSIIVSHYSTTYISFFILLLTISIHTFLNIFRKINSNLSTTTLFLFFTTFIYWYSFITYTPFYSGTVFILRIIRSMTNLYSIESRSGTFQKATGIGVSNIPMKLEFIFSWLIIIFVSIGALYILYYFITQIIFKNDRNITNLKLKTYAVEYLELSISCFLTLMFSVVSPHVSMGYGLERIFFQLSTVTSFLFIVGAVAFGTRFKINPCLILICVLIPFFLNTMGVTFQLFGSPRDISLNSEGPQYNIWFIKDIDYYGAQWLGKNIDQESSITCTTNRRVLLQQFSAYHTYLHYDLENKNIGSYIYHSYNLIYFNNTTSFDYATLQLDINNKIYTNEKNMMIFERLLD